ncbi:hypothetical protein L1987_17922 [Smallanthus sonchifolius]|uniref:Uncharacterized protein n=1 Tax=Smallanthus sonchifolius TaxID=185202 RepID=A0ACB9IY51_9ASTR|nr:hypothetical protein L1987_17922 [Smallanthus sonchifolius]
MTKRHVVLKREEPPLMDSANSSNTGRVHVRYGECQRNHAANVGGYAVDGCREFMAVNDEEEGSLTCAACGCHRNFHRRVVETEVEAVRSSDYDEDELTSPNYCTVFFYVWSFVEKKVEELLIMTKDTLVPWFKRPPFKEVLVRYDGFGKKRMNGSILKMCVNDPSPMNTRDAIKSWLEILYFDSMLERTDQATYYDAQDVLSRASAFLSFW